MSVGSAPSTETFQKGCKQVSHVQGTLVDYSEQTPSVTTAEGQHQQLYEYHWMSTGICFIRLFRSYEDGSLLLFLVKPGVNHTLEYTELWYQNSEVTNFFES